MKKILILYVFLLFSVILMFPAKAKIFFVNLYSENVDVQLGEDNDFVIQELDKEPYTATDMLVTDRMGSYKLYFKTSAEKKWYFWADDKKRARTCVINDGDVLCILFGYEGTINYYIMKEPKGTGAKICLLNGTDETLPKMAVAKTWEGDSDVFVENIDSNVISNFDLLKQGNYGLFWQFEEQVADERYFFYPDDNGDVEMINFKNGNYYLFMAYKEDDKKYAVWYNITPQ
jgi:hypothetical protein